MPICRIKAGLGSLCPHNSSATGEEAKVRQAMIKTGDVDVMIAIRSNFSTPEPCHVNSGSLIKASLSRYETRY